MSKGYLYIVSNNVGGVSETDYIREAIYSAKSLKKVDKNAKICLITDRPIKNDIFDTILIREMSIRCKPYYLLHSPYDKTIYIDSDTYINHNIDDLFEVLDKYDVAMIHDYARKRIFPIPEYMKIPTCFSEVNGGIMAYKKNDRITNLINKWKHYYEKYKKVVIWDQPSLRIALWESDALLFILPNEYNRRGKHTKQKCINCRKSGDKRFPKDHLKTRIFHFHGLEKLDQKGKENHAQHF